MNLAPIILSLVDCEGAEQIRMEALTRCGEAERETQVALAIGQKAADLAGELLEQRDGLDEILCALIVGDLSPIEALIAREAVRGQ